MKIQMFSGTIELNTKEEGILSEKDIDQRADSAFCFDFYLC